MIGKYVIVRGDRSGVFAGVLKSLDGRTVVLSNCRRLWYWSGAASISQIAMEGVKYPRDCKFTVTVDNITILDAIEISNMTIHHIDGVETIITSVHGNVAKGYIVQSDLTLTPCYVVKGNHQFAHGNTLRDAMSALTDKMFDNMPEEERIAEFIKAHPDKDKAYPNQDLFDWHHRLTGSCMAGRNAFVKDRGLTLDGETSVTEFIRLTKNAYGGSTIKALQAVYEGA